jgi:hypothetical protein
VDGATSPPLAASSSTSQENFLPWLFLFAEYRNNTIFFSYPSMNNFFRRKTGQAWTISSERQA